MLSRNSFFASVLSIHSVQEERSGGKEEINEIQINGREESGNREVEKEECLEKKDYERILEETKLYQ